MLSVLLLVLPIFALVFAGWLARRCGVLGPHATTELNRFVVWLALPAMLFDIIANAHWHDIWQPGFIAASGLGMAVVFVLTLALRLRAARSLADAAIDALNASYANTGFMGFPLALALFGPASLAPTLAAVILTVCILFGAALVLIEFGLQADRGTGRPLGNVARALARNPLLVAPAVGALFLPFGIGLPRPADAFLKLLGGAASPCALVALGLFLAEPTIARPTARVTALLVALKLVVQPLLTWLVAGPILHLPPPAVRLAVLLGALPTGTGPFMIAEYYGREAAITARTILLSTIGALVTIALCLGLLA